MKELPQEEAARVRRQNKQRAKRQSANAPGTNPSLAKNLKSFQMSTYKLHAMGDYVQQIEHFGSTDSYSTQPVCSLIICYILITVLDPTVLY